MLNLEPRNETRAQTPEENNKILFLNEEGDLVLKDDAGDIKYVTISDVKPPKVYKALLSQSGTDAPTAIVLENTLGGEVVWGRAGVGTYEGTLAGAFAEGKTFTFMSHSNSGAGANNDFLIYDFYRSNSNVVTIEVYDIDLSTDTEAPIDEFINGTSILIEVYS